MRKLWRQWGRVSQKLEEAPHRLFLFGFDGTLAPIAPTPRQAHLPPQTRTLLRRLSERRHSTVGIVSGRSLPDLRRRVRLPEQLYVGNHGFEFEAARRRWVHPEAKRRVRSLLSLAGALSKTLSSIPGAWIENKGFTLSVHFRQVLPRRRSAVGRLVRQTLAHPGGRTRWDLRRGKMTLEIRPAVEWNKGSVLALLRKRCPKNTELLYVGDDFTDEDAFRVVGRDGIAVRIGARKRSPAPYYLGRQKEVQRLLEKLVTL